MSFNGYIVTYQDKGLILDLSHGSPTPGTAAIIQTPNPSTLNQQVSAVLYLAVSRNLKLKFKSHGLAAFAINANSNRLVEAHSHGSNLHASMSQCFAHPHGAAHIESFSDLLNFLLMHSAQGEGCVVSESEADGLSFDLLTVY